MATAIGKVIRRMRRDRDWTLEDLSNETRKHGRYLVGTTISRHESGQQRPTTDILEIYAKAFGVGSASDLLRLTSDPNLHTSKGIVPQTELTYAQVQQITQRLTRIVQDILEIIPLLGSAPAGPPDRPARDSEPPPAPASRDRARRPGQR